MVGVDLGAVSLCNVLVHSLGLGYDARAAITELDLPCLPANGGLAWTEGLGNLRRAVGSGCAIESIDAFISAVFRIVGVVPAAQARAAIAWRSCAGFRHLLCLFDSVASAQLSDLRPVCIYP